MDYQTVSEFAQTYGLIYLLLLFIPMMICPLWQENRRRFEDAAKIPLRED